MAPSLQALSNFRFFLVAKISLKGQADDIFRSADPLPTQGAPASHLETPNPHPPNLTFPGWLWCYPQDRLPLPKLLCGLRPFRCPWSPPALGRRAPNQTFKRIPVSLSPEKENIIPPTQATVTADLTGHAFTCSGNTFSQGTTSLVQTQRPLP